MKISKTLGPASAELLLNLSARGKKVFSIADAQAITDNSYEATTTLLSQLVRKFPPHPLLKKAQHPPQEEKEDRLKFR